MTPLDAGRGSIEHIVVLMLENRSFDSLLGYLYERTEPARFVPSYRHEPFNGVAGKERRLFNLPSPFTAADVANPKVHVRNAPWRRERDMLHPFPDPGEPYPHVTHQLFGDPLANGSGTPRMNGFVADYVLAVAEHQGGGKAGGWERN